MSFDQEKEKICNDFFEELSQKMLEEVDIFNTKHSGEIYVNPESIKFYCLEMINKEEKHSKKIDFEIEHFNWCCEHSFFN